MRLTIVMVGILAQQQHIRALVGRQLQRGADIRLWWEDRVLAPLLGQELLELVVVGLLGLAGQDRLPAGRDRWCHRVLLLLAPLLDTRSGPAGIGFRKGWLGRWLTVIEG